MIAMNISKWIEDIITSDKSLSMPIMTHPGIELLGKKVLDAVAIHVLLGFMQVLARQVLLHHILG